jgi:uncharacterized protein YdcH (DUF465 family)
VNNKAIMPYSDKEKIMKIEKRIARLEQLKLEHKELDHRVEKDYNLRLDVTELKVQKLRLKQEILDIEKELAVDE